MPQYFDSTASFPMKTKKRVYAKGGRTGYYGGGRTNLLEELGRVEGERSNPNRRAEVSRVHSELNRGYKKGGWIQKATASIKKRGTEGKCTPITKPGCTGRAKALAKTFKKMARKRKAS
jgi:predicted hydrocarbon binding protein